MSLLSDSTRRNRSIRFNRYEWDEVTKAAGRMTKADLSTYSWDRSPAPPATWVQAMAMDWARYLSGLPAAKPAEKPSAVVKRLEERNARLEQLVRELGGGDPTRVLNAARFALSPADEVRRL
ncbi:hypothetical protein [Archangium sp.]|uniref:hypothetical protein n=1 Tax=Archangium sp. TaxID=1872627 RepID=UPI00286CE2ED|nr:hypothetical protein [Archangium sp.]